MDTSDAALLHRLTTCDFDASGAELSLRDRLARDNGWSRERTDRVLDE